MEFRYSGFFVRDVPSTVAFYQKAFGLGPRYMRPSNGYAELETGATLLAFVKRDRDGFIVELCTRSPRDLP